MYVPKEVLEKPRALADDESALIRELKKKSGSVYDPDVVNAFLQLVLDGGLLVKGWVEQT